MRIKSYLIFLGIFTIGYILFFLIYDIRGNKKLEAKNLEQLNSITNIENYNLFAKFYGIESKATPDVIMAIYNELKNVFNVKISYLSAKFNISSNEIIVILLYLEYFNLINRKSILSENDLIMKTTYKEQDLINKYTDVFNKKLDLTTISSLMGVSAVKDISYLNNKLLIPGVRFINSTLYYLGDLK